MLSDDSAALDLTSSDTDLLWCTIIDELIDTLLKLL